MIKFTTGNILESDTDALVNTVNCEGYMGKGIAYQFKLKFPQNNEEYVKACNAGQFTIGNILTFREDDKYIINFPTKDKWRRKSEYNYITTGLRKLVQVIPEINISSISIPPLGCGNGGLEWGKVKDLIVEYLTPLQNELDIVIFEPSKYYTNDNVKKIPKMNSSHLILMASKKNINNFNKSRLQKTIYLMTYLANDQYFKFTAHKFGPYSHSLDILSRDIKEYQDYHGVNTEDAIEIVKNIIISDSVKKKYDYYKPFLSDAIQIVNSIQSSRMLEAFTTLLFIIEKNNPIERIQLNSKLKEWSEYKANKFTDIDIDNGLQLLLEHKLIMKGLMGYEANHY